MHTLDRNPAQLQKILGLNAFVEHYGDEAKYINVVTRAGCVHEDVISSDGNTAAEKTELHWINVMLYNFKAALRSNINTLIRKTCDVPAEFEIRSN